MATYLFNDVSTNWLITAKTIQPKSGDTLTVIGDLSGNVIGGSSGTVKIANDNTNADFYPVFVSDNSGNLPLKVDKTPERLSYNPSTNALSISNLVIQPTGISKTTPDPTVNLEINLGCSNTNVDRYSSLSVFSGNQSYWGKTRIYAGKGPTEYSTCTVDGDYVDFSKYLYEGQSESNTIAGVRSYEAGGIVSSFYAWKGTQSENSSINTIIRVTTTRISFSQETGPYSSSPAFNDAQPNIAEFSLANAIRFHTILRFANEGAGIQNRTTTVSISTTNPFTLDGSGLTFRNYNVTYGSATDISGYNFTNVPLNAIYTISIYNSGTGNVTFTGSSAIITNSVRVGGGANPNTFTIPQTRYCICELKRTSVNNINIYFMNFTLM